MPVLSKRKLRWQSSLQEARKTHNGCFHVQVCVVQFIEDLEPKMVALSSAVIKKESMGALTQESHFVSPDYWTRKCASGERSAGIRGILD